MTNPTPYFSRKELRCGERTLPMLSGEVHYWRLDPRQWRPALERVRELGIEMVATYICWDFHELADGRLDFHGETDGRRNVVAFLELLQELNFDVIIRPGPYIYSEWSNNGVPQRVAGFHRLDPRFLAEAESYIQSVVAAIRPYLASRGGKIALLQADNEIDPWPALFTEPLGLGKSPGIFHQFLQERYQSVEALNRAWGTGYAHFEEAHATCAEPNDQPAAMLRYLDFVRFKHWYVKRVAEWAVTAYRKAGVDVPILLNGYDGLGTQHWGEMETVADVYGQDIYPTNEFTKWQDEFRFLLEKGRFARAISRVPYIGEFEAGVWHGWHYLTGTLTSNQYRMATVGALAGGVVGWNWYMLVNRDNWYMAPINEWGRVRPELFTTFQKLVSMFRCMQPATLRHACTVGVTIDPLQRSVVKPGEMVLKALYSAGIDYEFFDLWGGTSNLPVVFYAGGPWLNRAGQQRLLDYARRGGHLVFLGVYPELDDQMQDCQLLPLKRADGVIPVNGPLTLMLGGREIRVSGSRLEWFQSVSGSPITAVRMAANNLTSEELVYQHGLETGNEYIIGSTQVEGRGAITYLGLEPDPALLLQIVMALGVHQPVRGSHPHWPAVLYTRGNEGFLTVVNPTGAEGSCEFTVEAGDRFHGVIQIEDLLRDQTGQAFAVAGKFSLVCSLPGKDATVLHFWNEEPHQNRIG